MKKILLLFVLSISFLATSQDVERSIIKGKIVIEGVDIEGITIFNSVSNIGTVSNKNGEFTLAVALNDLIEIRALKYQNLDVRINEAIIASKKVSIFLIEEINKLDEIIVSSKPLTGNLKSDVNKIQLFIPKYDAIYFGKKNNDLSSFTDDERRLLESESQHEQSQTLVDGLNIVTIVDQLLIPLFRSEVKDKKAAGIPAVPVKSIKYYLGSEFLVENFDIPNHRVEEFIRYVEDEAFDFELLNYGHEIEFLELLSKKSDTFLNVKPQTD